MERTAVWTTKLQNGDAVAVIVNWNDLLKDKAYKLKISDLGISPKAGQWVKTRNLWTHTDVSTLVDEHEDLVITLDPIEPHDNQMLQFTIFDKNPESEIQEELKFIQ